jgi:WD40 repeat protein
MDFTNYSFTTINSVKTKCIKQLLDIDDKYFILLRDNAFSFELWDKLTKKCIHTFNGHISAIIGLIYNKGYVYSIGYDKYLKIWDVKKLIEVKFDRRRQITIGERTMITGDEHDSFYTNYDYLNYITI